MKHKDSYSSELTKNLDHPLAEYTTPTQATLHFRLQHWWHPAIPPSAQMEIAKRNQMSEPVRLFRYSQVFSKRRKLCYFGFWVATLRAAGKKCHLFCEDQSKLRIGLDRSVDANSFSTRRIDTKQHYTARTNARKVVYSWHKVTFF